MWKFGLFANRREVARSFPLSLRWGMEIETKTVVIDSSMLASLDEARDYDAALSHHWLNAKMRDLFAVVQTGGRVQIESQTKTILLDSKLAFVGWAIGRYTHAEFGQSKISVIVVIC